MYYYWTTRRCSIVNYAEVIGLRALLLGVDRRV
jgi:hypothetical protein